MYFDGDIKIADIDESGKLKTQSNDFDENISSDDRLKAHKLGETLAEIFSKDASNFKYDNNDSDYEMTIERRLLLSFTVTVSLEKYCKNDTVAGVAQKNFIDCLKSISEEIYRTSADTGAFSFYYLAYRRNTDVVRRIGQTFAMLCSHDGDSVYQELGEALYCWFSSVVKENAEKLGLSD